MRSLLGPALFAVSIAACSGASDSGLFSGAFGGSDSGVSSVDASAALDASDDASAKTDAAPPDGGMHSNDAGAGGVDAGSVAPDSGTDSGDPGIACGTDSQGNGVFCAVGQEECCASPSPSGNGPAYDCVSSAGQCGGTRITCDDTADCAGRICCGAFDQSTQTYREISCRSSCSGTGPGGATLVRMCDATLMPSDCPQGTTCTQSGVLPGFFYCN